MSEDRLREFYVAMLRDMAQYDFIKLELIDAPMAGFPPYYTRTDNSGLTTFYLTHDLMSIYQCSEGDMLLDFPDFLD